MLDRKSPKVRGRDGASTQRRMSLRRSILAHARPFGTLAVLIVLGGVVSALTPYFLTVSNLLNVAQQTVINAVIAVGMTWVIISGGIDLSVGSMLAFSGVVLAEALHAGWPLPLAIALRLNQRLTASGRTAREVSVFRCLGVKIFSDGFPRQGGYVGSSIAEVDLGLEIVVSPEAAPTFVAHIGNNAGISLPQGIPALIYCIRCRRRAAIAAATALKKLAVPVGQRKQEVKPDIRGDIALNLTMGGYLTAKFH